MSLHSRIRRDLVERAVRRQGNAAGNCDKSLNQSVHEVIAMADVRSRFADVGIEGTASTPDELTARVRKDVEKWAKVIEKAGIPKQ